MAKKLIIGLILILIVSGAAAIAIFDNIGGRIIDEALEEAAEEQPEDATQKGEDPGKAPDAAQGQSPTAPAGTDTTKKQEEEKPQITKDKIKEVKESVTVVDKATITKMVLQHLTAADIEELKNLAAGGLTAEEKARAKEIAYSRFTKEEIQRIQELYTKYLQSK